MKSLRLVPSPMCARVLPLTLCTIAAFLLAPMRAGAQTASAGRAPGPAAATKIPAEDETVTLSPFEVRSTSDHSYGALNSNSVTSFNTELAKVAVSAEVFDRAFLDDVGAFNVEELFQTYSAGAGVSSLTPEATAGGFPEGIAFNSNMTMRGVTMPRASQRDGFLLLGNTYDLGATSPYGGGTSTFDLERVEVIKGPQSLLYTGGGAGGVLVMISKQARFRATPATTLRFYLDMFGSKIGQGDFSLSKGPLAVRVSILSEHRKTRLLNLGGTVNGYYTQFAYRLLKNTTIRLTGEQTTSHRIMGKSLTLSAGSAARDSRNGLGLRSLLVKGQAGATDPATGAAYGSGPLLNGELNLDNVTSHLGWLASGQTINAFGILTVETKWNSALISMLSLGYNDFRYDLPQTNTNVLYTPGNNATGKWAVGAQPFDQSRPGRNKAIRYNLLAHHKFFRGRVDSQTVFGADYGRNDSANITYGWFLADSNWNVVRSTVLGSQQGRTQVPSQVYAVEGGLVKYPLWAPRTPRVTINGVNYLRMLSNEVQPNLISAENPLGINGTSNYQQTKLMNKGLYAANYSDWFEGRFTTMVGARLAKQFGRGATNTYNAVMTSETTNYNFGVNTKLNSWLYPYFAVSSSYQPPVSFNPGPYRTPPKLGHAVGQEGGIKFTSGRGGLSGSLAYYHTNAINEAMSVSSTIFNDVNPDGINGRYGGSASNWVNVNRVTKGVEAVLTASPTPNWRVRLSAARTKGAIKNGLILPLLYNDQFYTNSAQQVTYADKTVVYVAPTFNARTPVVTPTTPGAVPLTVAMMSDPTSVYYANPINPSGQIRSSSNVATVLAYVDPVHGPIATGATGLPVSALQIDTRPSGFTPPDLLTAIVAGERTTGYPLYSATLTSMYTIRGEGWTKGFRIGGTVASSWDRLSYYYYPDISTSLNRDPYRTPSRWQLDLILGYERKFRRVNWSTQLNVYNLSNHYEWIVTPSSITGWRTISNLGTFMIGSPRTWQLSTTFSF